MKIRNIKQLIEDAEKLEIKLTTIALYVNEDEDENETDVNLVQFKALLETDSTVYNIDALEEFVKYNTESIELKYEEVLGSDDCEEPTRTLAELKHIHTAFEIDWIESIYCKTDDSVAKRESWLNWLDALTKDGELTEDEAEEVLAELV